jgi:hypothetical protein
MAISKLKNGKENGCDQILLNLLKREGKSSYHMGGNMA